MNIDPENLSSVLKKEISKFEEKLDVSEVGTVISVGDAIAKIYGLENAMASELLSFPHGIIGMVLNLEQEIVSAALFGSQELVKEGDHVKRTGKIVSVKTGSKLLGRVVNGIGEPLDEKGPIESGHNRPVEIVAPGVVEREPVNVPLQTGIKAIDAMIPIGRGQRELIIGDRQTGKTAIALDTIINQKGKDVLCVYVSIGQKSSQVARVIEVLEKYDALSYTVVVAASASDSVPLQYIAPFAGCTIAEEFMNEGKDALIIYDDLSKHANSYRQLSLLLRRPPGREAYPGDIFYLHSRLLERAAKLSKKNKGGSLTALPIIETQGGDITTYIPTNLISITDGQIYLESSLFYSGIRPAINVGLSVSRVGGQAQTKAMKQVAGRLRLDLAQYRELESFAQFGTELDEDSQRQLELGRRLTELLKQGQFETLQAAEQVALLYTGTQGLLDDISVQAISDFEQAFLKQMRQTHQELLGELSEKKELNEKITRELEKVCAQVKTELITT